MLRLVTLLPLDDSVVWAAESPPECNDSFMSTPNESGLCVSNDTPIDILHMVIRLPYTLAIQQHMVCIK
mgnify:CR=1 FL=1